MLEGKRRQVWDNAWLDSCLDLHLMSIGAAQAMVHAWLLNIRSVVFEGHELPKLLRYRCLYKDQIITFQRTALYWQSPCQNYLILFVILRGIHPPFETNLLFVQHFDWMGKT